MNRTTPLATAHLRVARPTDNLDAVVRFYRDGLGFDVVGEFADHAGFDGVMLGHNGAGYHLEFTRKAGHAAGRAPTPDNLLVFYLPDAVAWAEAVKRMESAGCAPVVAFNPYWDRQGKTFEDPDGYRVVLQNADWPAARVRIDHVGLWVSDLEAVRTFYETYFGARAGAKYTNSAKAFESYFLTFPGAVRLELMRVPELGTRAPERTVGFAHVAVSVGSERAVDAFAARLRTDGYDVVDGPRRTGDGYYECVVLDPEGNRVEITV